MKAEGAAAAPYTVYVLGAGASHEGGVPLSAQILPAGYALLGEIRARGESRRGDYVDRLGPAHARAFARVYDFVARVFQARESAAQMDLANLPTLDELWALLEIGHERRATFGFDASPEDTTAVRTSLMALMYHVLVGCRIPSAPDAERARGADEGTGADESASGDAAPPPPPPPSTQLPVCYADAESANPYTRFVARLSPGDVVVALNYDTLLDRALEAAGCAIDYGTDVLRAPRHAGEPRRAAPQAGATIGLLKLHGSFGWLYCPSCRTIEDYGTDVAHLPLEAGDRDARCPRDGAPREQIIIPPSLVKSYENLHVQRIWDSAARRLRGCARLVFVGYAMSDADVYVRYMVKQATTLNRALAAPPGPGEPPRIVAVNRARAALEGYARLFGRERVEPVPMSFGEWVASRAAP